MENSLDLTKFFDALKKYWKLLLLLPIILLVISLLITFLFMQPKYEASTQVLINQSSKNKEIMAQEVQSNLQLVNTYAEIIKSPRVIDEVAKRNKNYSSSDIEKMLTVDKQSDSQVISIDVRNKNKNKAEKVANDIAKTVKDVMPKIMKIDNVSILSSADGTAKKVSPKPLLNILAGIIIGIFIALIIIMIKEMFDKRIKNEEDVEKELNLPVLGSIQKIK